MTSAAGAISQKASAAAASAIQKLRSPSPDSEGSSLDLLPSDDDAGNDAKDGKHDDGDRSLSEESEPERKPDPKPMPAVAKPAPSSSAGKAHKGSTTKASKEAELSDDSDGLPGSSSSASPPQRKPKAGAAKKATAVADEDDAEKTASLDTSSESEAEPVKRGPTPPCRTPPSKPAPAPAAAAVIAPEAKAQTSPPMPPPTTTTTVVPVSAGPVAKPAPKASSLLQHLLTCSAQGHPYDTSSPAPASAPNQGAVVPHHPLSMAVTYRPLRASLPTRPTHSLAGHKLLTPVDPEAEPLDFLEVRQGWTASLAALPSAAEAASSSSSSTGLWGRESQGEGCGSPEAGTVSLRNGGLTSLGFRSFVGITVLDCAHNGLTELAGLPPTLRRLDASCNAITHLGDALRQCPHLEVLNLRRNRLRSTAGL
eukprot:RCo002409